MTTKQYITQLLAEIKEKGCTISEEVLSGSLDTLVTLAKGEQRLEENRVYMDSLNNSKEIIGHHITEPEDVMSPSEMVKGEWYVISAIWDYVVKFSYESCYSLFAHDAWCLTVNSQCDNKNICDVRNIKSLRPATREEVLKYFPNEFK
jgi:hypothetical protein